MVHSTGFAPLHAGPESASLTVLLAVGAVGTALLLGLAIAAFLRRQSRPYLLVAMAFAALFARTLVAGAELSGRLSPQTHHTIEHGLDVVLVALVVAAVYYARTTSTTGGIGE